ncbi:MAG: hypothetical protein ABSE63_01410 [Thermoguttaceae bacterium]
MAIPPEKPEDRTNPLLDDAEFRIAPAPVRPRVVPAFVEKAMRAVEEKHIAAAKEPTPRPPRWPMLSGIFLYPFYLSTLGSWMFISAGLMVFGWLLMFWIEYGAMDTSTAYYLGLPTCTAGVLAFGYAASCLFSIIEGTSNGWDSFEVSPGIEWKEWIWSFLHISALLAQAGVVGYALELVCSTDSWLPMAVGTLAVFPLVLLGALAADGAWAPLAIGKTLQSLFLAGWAWGLFYLETTPMIAGWTWLVKTQLAGQGAWLAPLYAGPLLATIILIYARLIGRLAGCISAATAKLLDEGDDDES